MMRSVKIGLSYLGSNRPLMIKSLQLGELRMYGLKFGLFFNWNKKTFVLVDMDCCVLVGGLQVREYNGFVLWIRIREF